MKVRQLSCVVGFFPNVERVFQNLVCGFFVMEESVKCSKKAQNVLGSLLLTRDPYSAHLTAGTLPLGADEFIPSLKTGPKQQIKLHAHWKKC